MFKIIDLPARGCTRNPADWINNNIDIIISGNNDCLTNYVKEKENFGCYMQDECRNALAHIHRIKPQRSGILPFKSSDYGKISYANGILFKLAEKFIKDEFGIPENKAINVIQIDELDVDTAGMPSGI